MTEPSPSLTHRTIRGMAWVAWWSAAIAVMRLGVLVLLTRLLTPADFGVVSAAMVFITFSLNFSQLGMGPALVQRPALQARHITTAFLASTSLGILVGGVVWAAAPLIARFFHMDQLVPVVRALAFVFPIAGLSVVSESLLQRELRFRFVAYRDMLAYGLGYGLVGVVLALLGFGVWALVAAQLTQGVLRTAILLRGGPPLLWARPTWTCFLELMEYGIGQSVGRLGVILANQVDNLVVGRWLGAPALGQYNRAFQLVSVPTALLGDTLDKVLFPTMARVQDDPRRLASAFLQGTALLALLTLPAGVVIAVLAPELVAVAFGSRWEALVAPFQVLALGVTFRTSYRMSDSLSRATGKVYRACLAADPVCRPRLPGRVHRSLPGTDRSGRGRAGCALRQLSAHGAAQRERGADRLAPVRRGAVSCDSADGGGGSRDDRDRGRDSALGLPPVVTSGRGPGGGRRNRPLGRMAGLRCSCSASMAYACAIPFTPTC